MCFSRSSGTTWTYFKVSSTNIFNNKRWQRWVNFLSVNILVHCIVTGCCCINNFCSGNTNHCRIQLNFCFVCKCFFVIVPICFTVRVLEPHCIVWSFVFTINSLSVISFPRSPWLFIIVSSSWWKITNLGTRLVRESWLIFTKYNISSL